jgi:predicted small integral membrane protein
LPIIRPRPYYATTPNYLYSATVSTFLLYKGIRGGSARKGLLFWESRSGERVYISLYSGKGYVFRDDGLGKGVFFMKLVGERVFFVKVV